MTEVTDAAVPLREGEVVRVPSVDGGADLVGPVGGVVQRNWSRVASVQPGDGADKLFLKQFLTRTGSATAQRSAIETRMPWLPRLSIAAARCISFSPSFGLPPTAWGIVHSIVPISVRKLRKPTSMSGSPAQAREPGLSSTVINIWFSGVQMPRTKMTAKPRPIAVSTFLETAISEHIPRKKARAMFSTKMAFVAKLK